MNCADALCYCFSSGLQSSKFDRKANMTDKETTKTISVLKCSTLDFFTAVLSGISFPIGFPAPPPPPPVPVRLSAAKASGSGHSTCMASVPGKYLKAFILP